MIGASVLAQRVARGRVLQANDGDDIASGAGVDVDALVGVHLKQAADALFLILGGVGHIGTSVQMAGVHAQVGELADERVGHDLEREGR